MSLTNTLERLYRLRNRGMKLDLERMREAVRRRGNPEHEIGLVVHVAGTNGKGSTASMVESIARAAGLRTGLYSSPHLHRFGERIRVDGVPLDDDTLEPRVDALMAAMEEPGFPELSFFEVTTILAFEAFRDLGTDVAILEVGLGGRLDATNVARADVAMITRIAEDHEHILGTGLAAIAGEKAGIIEAGRPLITTRQDPAAFAVLASVADERGAAMRALGRDFDIRPSADGERSRLDVVFDDEVFGRLEVGLEGCHQVDNAACAVAAVRALREAGVAIDRDAVTRGLADVRWPGRMERIAAGPTVLLDIAHNPDACLALAAHFATTTPRRRALVFGAMRDKNIEMMLRHLCEHFPYRFWTRAREPRAEEPARLAGLAYGEVVRDVARAVSRAQAMVGPDGEVVVTGSAFVVAEARAMLLDLPSEPAIAL